MRILALTLALAGCATQIPAEQASDWQVCENTMGGGRYAQIADAERTRRGLDCNPYYSAILAKRQQQSKALQDAANYLNRPAPPIQPMPAPTTCRTFPTGGGAYQTVCN